MATATTTDKAWGQIVARAWQDESFKRRLLADPAAVLKEEGMELPARVKVKILEDGDQVVHLTLPQKPQGELSEQALAEVAGGHIVVTKDLGD
jgi:hypothetical protein